MVWAAVAAAVGTVALGTVNANRASKDAAKNRDAQLDIAETPTRTTGIENLLRELTSTASEEGLSSESQSILDELMQDESFAEQVTSGTAESQAALSDALQGGDGQAQVDAMVNKILREGKAGISNVGTRTGSFGSTTEQLLTNDLIAKAAEAGVGQQNVIDARTLQAINLAQEGNTATTGEKSTESSRDTSSQTDQTTSSTTESESTDQQRAETDTLQNPNDNVTVSGDLADLITQGIGGDAVPETAASRRARGLAALEGQQGPFSDEMIEAAAAADTTPQASTPLTSIGMLANPGDPRQRDPAVARALDLIDGNADVNPVGVGKGGNRSNTLADAGVNLDELGADSLMSAAVQPSAGIGKGGVRVGAAVEPPLPTDGRPLPVTTQVQPPLSVSQDSRQIDLTKKAGPVGPAVGGIGGGTPIDINPITAVGNNLPELGNIGQDLDNVIIGS